MCLHSPVQGCEWNADETAPGPAVPEDVSGRSAICVPCSNYCSFSHGAFSHRCALNFFFSRNPVGQMACAQTAVALNVSTSTSTVAGWRFVLVSSKILRYEVLLDWMLNFICNYFVVFIKESEKPILAFSQSR